MVGINTMSESKNRNEYYKQYREEHKEEIKQHYRDNRDTILAQVKEYKQHNQDKVKAYRQEHRKVMVMCPNCKCQTNQHHLTRHQRTQRCHDKTVKT